MHEDKDHTWFLAYWSGRNDFGVGVFVCHCAAVKRVIYDPKDIQIVDPKNIQEVHQEREKGRVGRWSGE